MSNNIFTTIVFKNNSIIRLTLSFDVIAHQRNHIELYGTKGSMIVRSKYVWWVVLFVKNWAALGKNLRRQKYLGRINIRTQSSRANESPTNANYRGLV